MAGMFVLPEGVLMAASRAGYFRRGLTARLMDGLGECSWLGLT
jgi:hypothetical protein